MQMSYQQGMEKTVFFYYQVKYDIWVNQTDKNLVDYLSRSRFVKLYNISSSWKRLCSDIVILEFKKIQISYMD